MPKTILSRYLDAEVLHRVASLHIEPRSLVIGNLAGAHKSPLSGFAVEFKGHREYVPGDDPKHIDWRVYFNRDKYFIKQYEMETNFVCHLLLDVSASMRYGEEGQQKLTYAASLAATLGYSIIRQSDKVSLATFDDQVRDVVPPSNSLAQVTRITSHLDQVKPVEKTRMAECLNELAGRMGRREIVIILSDFFTPLQPLESVLQRFRFDQHEVVLFQVLHHDELEFQFDGMVKFVGLEVDDEILAQPEVLRDSYLQAMTNHRRELDAIAHRNRCELVLADTQRNMAETLADYLHQRSLLNRGR
ncbi:MAG: DUF58 domain-containing protein [Planctomycetia bacterium]|nr:DUF58 domain-containing protein [Planctomycetia bacterium]